MSRTVIAVSVNREAHPTVRSVLNSSVLTIISVTFIVTS